MNNLLFIYGTLLDSDNEYAVFLRKNSHVYAPGKVKGKLYDIGEYPGAILAANTDNYIHGTVLQLNDPEKVLPVIDDYEGFGDDQAKPNLFIRVLTEAQIETGPVSCWVYVYNLSVGGLRLIENGIYTK